MVRPAAQPLAGATASINGGWLARAVHIRRATPADAPAIHALMLAAFEPFRSQYTEGCYDATVLDPARIRQRMAEGPVWVVEDGPQPGFVGTVSGRADGRGFYVRGMAVHPDARRRGVGRLLLQAAEAHARAEGLACLWLSTTRFLIGSQRLYEGFGFAPAAGPRDLFGVPLVSYEKALAP